MKTKVVHCKKEKYDILIDRTGIFGNPFYVCKIRNREQAIKEFKEYFYKRIEHDLDFKNAVLTLKGKILGCWCKPKACHGDIYVEYLEGINNA